MWKANIKQFTFSCIRKGKYSSSIVTCYVRDKDCLLIIQANDPQALPWALDALERGALVVIPTDTVYGLAARLDRPEALEHLYVAKGREADKAIPVLISDAERLHSLTDGAPDGVAEFAARFWPGPLTIVLPCADSVPVLVTAGTGTIGVRMPAHPIALEIIEGCGLSLIHI